MDPRAKDIATRAGRLGGAERTRFLDQTCSGDRTLRDTVEHLLRLQDEATIQTDAPSTHDRHRPTDPGERSRPDAPTVTGPTPFRISDFQSARGQGLPDRVGAYKILGELGAGAMGQVYLAEQRHPKRRVALKVVRPEVLTPDRERRFDLETEALARLRHPGIATIFEAGRADLHGRPHPFFAMELVQGRPLDDHARDLDERDRVLLIASVCDAVEHAHRRGILHRDLKPANILVDEEGRARVLDFGVARSLEGGTAEGELVGTVPYMSPEQLNADPDVDARSDVYALGVILCEVLTGRRPHDVSGMTVDQAQAVVSKPATLDRTGMGFELAGITAKAIHPDRDRRYESAGDLAADLRRYLACEPVTAVDAGAWYKTRKFACRNRGVVALAGLAAGIFVVGSAAVAWQATRATRGWHQAELETRRAEDALVGEAEQRARAEAALTRAEEERKKVMAVNVFMTRMLTSVDPEIAMGSELTVRELLDNSARTVGVELSETPPIEAIVRMALANSYYSLGEYASAEEQASAMVDLCRAKLGPTDPMTADAERTLAQVYADTGRLAEAEVLVRSATPVVEAQGDPIETARVHAELARVIYGMGRQEEALTIWQKSREEITAAAGPDHIQTLVMSHNMAMAMKDQGQLPQAEALARDLLERRRATLGEDHPQTLAAMDLLAGVIMKAGREGEAVPLLRGVVEGRSRILGPDHIATLLSMGNLGATLIRLGELDEAEPLTRKALEAHKAKFGPEHAKTLILMANLAYLLEERGKREEAAEIYRQTIDIRTRSTGGRDPETWAPMNNLAMIYQDIGRLEEARALYVELIAMCEEVLPAGHYYTALFRNNFGSCLTALGEYDAARTALESSHAVIVATFGEAHARTVRSLERIAELNRRLANN
jgi:tetratricopeptide (TPR) repeat protein/tRNA A-37 threonylcarbamoyl transferase component Bud32